MTKNWTESSLIRMTLKKNEEDTRMSTQQDGISKKIAKKTNGVGSVDLCGCEESFYDFQK